MRKIIYFLVAVAVLAILYFAYSAYRPRRTPTGQPGLATLEPRRLQELFNSSVDQTRILVLLSPT